MAEDNIERTRQRMLASLATEKQRLRQQNARLDEQIRHYPKPLDSEMDYEAAMQSSRLDPDQLIIAKWDDGNGNILFASGDVGPNQIPNLSARIATQGQAFQALIPSEQVQVRTAFQRPTSGQNTAPYQDFLKSEALGKRFQELKQKNTPTK